MIKLINKLGFFTKTQYQKLEEENKSLKRENSEAIYDFDTLLERYHVGQINALFYKLVNLCYRDEDKKHLLKRFKERLGTAIVD